MIKCDMCGKEIEPGKRPDGTPNGVAFELTDGSRITACSECIIESATNPDCLNEFLDRRGK